MNVKVICCYHKAAPQRYDHALIKYRDVFVPIFGGSEVSGELPPFFVNMKQDNAGDNISYLNPLVSEYTTIYWAYKHYLELGNPDMIGFAQYRRVFDLDYDNLNPNIVYLHRGENHRAELGRENMLKLMGAPYTQMLLDAFINDQPEYKLALDLVLDDFDFFDKSMFIMHRNLFFQYMYFLMRCFRVLLRDDIRSQLYRWAVEHPSRQMHDIIYDRQSGSYYFEHIAGVFFTQLQLMEYNIQLTPLTKESFRDY